MAPLPNAPPLSEMADGGRSREFGRRRSPETGRTEDFEAGRVMRWLLEEEWGMVLRVGVAEVGPAGVGVSLELGLWLLEPAV